MTVEGSTGRLVVEDGTGLHYRVDGVRDGPPVLFLNAIGTDLRLWDGQVAALADRCCVVRFDQRGHGRSDAPPGPYTVERLARDALAVLDGLGLVRVSVCGLALGGLVALCLAIYQSERIDRVVFANTAACFVPSPVWEPDIAEAGTLARAGYDDRLLAAYLSPVFREREPGVTARVREMVAGTSLNGLLASFAALHDADLRYLASTVLVPSLAIGGELDEIVPPALVEDLHAAIVPSELTILPGVGHLTNLEWPELFNRRLVEHVLGR